MHRFVSFARVLRSNRAGNPINGGHLARIPIGLQQRRSFGDGQSRGRIWPSPSACRAPDGGHDRQLLLPPGPTSSVRAEAMSLRLFLSSISAQG